MADETFFSSPNISITARKASFYGAYYTICNITACHLEEFKPHQSFAGWLNWAAFSGGALYWWLIPQINRLQEVVNYRLVIEVAGERKTVVECDNKDFIEVLRSAIDKAIAASRSKPEL